ncbi:hypothetical protein ABZ619_26055 [Streptomyces sp. NPDC007851]|uniref:hypothetical protein n=1 Tax=Streptomyces sp. NPDC007851 TaxID=3155008 RepID=UPI0033F6AED7
MLGGLLDLLFDRDGRVQQVHVPELEAEELAWAEPGGRAEQHEALVSGGYISSDRVRTCSTARGTIFFRGTEGSFASAHGL